MKFLIATWLIFVGFTYTARAQGNLDDRPDLTGPAQVEVPCPGYGVATDADRSVSPGDKPSPENSPARKTLTGKKLRKPCAVKPTDPADPKADRTKYFGPRDDDDKTATDPINGAEKFHWKPAMIQSLAFVSFQHVIRMAAEDKTRRELGGPFFKDWKDSVKALKGWRDGDGTLTNYIAHPMQGAFTGRIFINNSDNARKQEFGKSKAYWTSRLKAMAWSAAWSTQFEIGPLSEAAIGNVGLRKKNGYSTMAYVDLVVTPTVGTGFLIAEDAIDKYILKKWLEKGSDNKLKIRLARSFLTPTTSIANIIRGKPPWKRYDRPVVRDLTAGQ